MPANNVDKNSLIAINIENKNNILVFKNRLEASKEGFNTSKIGQSLRNMMYSHKNYIWFYQKDFDKIILERRLEQYNTDYRKKICYLYKKCTICKKEKSWLNFGLNNKKSNKVNRCNSCNSIRSCTRAKKNRNSINSWKKEWMKTPLNKLRINLGNRLRVIIKLKFDKNKEQSILKYLGCSREFLINYLELQFKSGMNWDNYGFYGWHIDHIKPLSLAKTEEELYSLCHYTNLQPLWAEENLSKGNKF